jgi:hypothetical protein
MKIILTTLTILLTQILSAQIYNMVDEIALFPACEGITDNKQKCYCNQSQFLLIGESNSQMTQVRLVIDGTGIINRWKTSSDNVEIISQVDFILGEMKSNIRLSPARIGGEPVNSEMIILMSVNNIEK